MSATTIGCTGGVIEVRRITSDEGAKLRELRLAALTDSPAAFGSTLEREVAFSDDVWDERASASASGSERITLLAWDGIVPAGIVGGYRAPDGHAVVELVSMWTRPTARARGIGSALVRGVLDWARATGAERVELWVVSGNASAQRLYEQTGFEVTADHQPHPNDPCAREVRMVHRLR